MDKQLDHLDRVLKALADPTRLRIVGMLQGGEVCVCNIHESLKISQPKASRHLAYLRRAGIVSTEKRGLWVHYRLAPQPDAVVQTILDTVRHGVTHLVSVQRDSARLQKSVGCVPDAVTMGALACCEPPATQSRRK